MRYTMRKRNIVWSSDPLVQEAVGWLENLLQSDSQYIYRATMQAGWGLVSNNVLHDRTAFSDVTENSADGTAKDGAGRLMYRARYHDRVYGS